MMDPNQQLLAGLHIAIGPDGRLYLVSLPQSQTAATPMQQSQATAQLAEVQRRMQNQIPQVVNAAVPLRAAAPGEILPEVNPGMANLSAMLSQALLSQTLGTMPIPTVTESANPLLQQYPQMAQHQQVQADPRGGESGDAIPRPLNNFEPSQQAGMNDPLGAQLLNNLLPGNAAPMMNAVPPTGAINPALYHYPSASNPPAQQQATHSPLQQAGQSVASITSPVHEPRRASVFPPDSATVEQQSLLPAPSPSIRSHPPSETVLESHPAPPSQHKGVVPNRPPTVIAMPFDAQNLSTYQCLAREQIEIFQAFPEDVEANAQGRNRPIVPGQVGIRCKHCAHLPHKQRKSGAVYFPSKVRINCTLVSLWTKAISSQSRKDTSHY